VSDKESFLERWSRRKRGVCPDARQQPKAEIAAGGAQSEVPAAAPPSESQAPFDPASLPSIESIDAGSDIRAFLAAGVPADLTRAALRRAWSADPTVRDFIGLSENAWDFNASEGVPGFGSVTPENVRRLLAQAIGEPEPADPARAAGATPSAPEAPVPTSDSNPPAEPAAQQTDGHDASEEMQEYDATVDRRDAAPRGERNIAMQDKSGKQQSRRPLPRRSHGGALPE
jgi:hypothetical protein